MPHPLAKVLKPMNRVWNLVSPKKRPKPEGSNSTEAKTPVYTASHIRPPLFALIIGINEYKSRKFGHLRGAVNDAQTIKSYLETSLGVPTSQIKTLYNDEATRDAIIDNMYALQKNPDIRPGDPILIFYAGHGSEAVAPYGWETGGRKIQLLVSYDALCEDNGRMIHGIPDRTIGVILENIAEAKGNNITVIFDCCHSGSLTRDEENQNRLVRGIKMAIELPSDLDRDTWIAKGGTSIAPGFLNSGLSSHVLLAACGAEEKAAEDEGMGVFTKSLLDTLIAVGPDKVTYADLIQRIPSLPLQNPQCEGHNQDRICFNSRAPSQRRHWYAVHKDGEQYVMDAGTAHGITLGAVFDIYEDRDSISSKAPLGTLTTASRPGAFSTILAVPSDHPEFAINNHAFALLTRAGEEADVRLHVLKDDSLKVVFEALELEMQTNPAQQITIVDEKEEAQLDVAFENDRIVLNILDPLVTIHGLTRMPFSIIPVIDDVRPVIRAAAHYYWHLRRTGNVKTLHNKVKIELTRVKQVEEEYDDDLNPVRRPYGQNLIHEGVVDLVVDKEAMYGIKIINTWDKSLYASVFFFDNSNLRITSYFQPPTSGGRVDAPLPQEGSLTIGYGSGGARPFRYTLSDGRDIDIGFVKVFLSTKQIDLSSIPQASPFTKNHRGQETIEDRPPELWDTALITVVQRRNPHA